MSWMRPRDHNIFVNIGSLVFCGLLAGVVVAAAFFPGAALSGLTVKDSLDQFDQLPSELTFDDAPEISYLYANDGETLLAAMYDEFRRNVPLHEIAPVMIEAMLAAEDKDFYQHNGVDIRGIARAFVANVAADDITQGASTITQQYVRLSLTYFSEDLQDVIDATDTTTGRKLREARYAIALEKQLAKDEILNGYLNLSYFGEGAYGIFAASQVYFGKRPLDLELHEAAFLAGLVQAPSEYSPTTDSGRQLALERRNWVLEQMVATEAITAAEAAETRQLPFDVEPERQPNMCVGVADNDHGFFCDFFYRWWLEQEAFGATVWEREQRLRGGGFRIVTSLDPEVQELADEHVEENLPTGEAHALMIAAIEPGTGKVRALATNRNFTLDDPGDPQNGPHTDPNARRLGAHGSYPNTTNPLMTGGGDITGYQAGSTFKIFPMVAALEAGMPLSTSINSPRNVTTTFPAEPGSGGAVCGNRWCPSNFPGQRPGRYNMWTGFGSSINTFFAQLHQRVGAENSVDAAKRMGIKFRASSGGEGNPLDAELALPENAPGWGPFTLGVSDTTPLDLANAYATISADGVHCEPLPVEEIRTLNDQTLDLANPNCDEAVDEQVARAVIDAGRCVVGAGSKLGGCSSGGGTASTVASTVGHPVWGKTGTSDEFRTSSLVISTSELAVAGQLVDPDWPQTNANMDSQIVQPAVREFLRDAMAGRDSSDWPAPTDRDLIRGREVDIPDVECVSIAEATRRLEAAGFDAEVADDPVESDCSPGQAAGTSPSGEAALGATITIEVSAGPGGPGGIGRPAPGPPDPDPDPEPDPGPEPSIGPPRPPDE